MKRIIIFLLIAIFFISFSYPAFSYGANFDVQRISEVPLNLYNSKSENFRFKITNQNSVCSIVCNYDGQTATISTWAKSMEYNYYITAPSSGKGTKAYKLEIFCVDACDKSNNTKTIFFDVSYGPECGNNNCEQGEDCSSCPNDCGACEGNSCHNGWKCETGKQCVHNFCRSSSTYCGDDYCDSGECSSCKADCSVGDCQWNGRCDIEIGENCESSNDCKCEYNEKCSLGESRADSKGCVKLCGNGRIDPGEDCNNCPEDYNCEGKGLRCGPYGQCVECIQTKDCEGKQTFHGEFFCSGNKRMERGIETSGVCENNQCVGSTEVTREAEDCGNRFCQDGHCSCSEGYEACRASGKCEKIAFLKEGEPCACDFQCESAYCSLSGRCMKAIDIAFSSEKDIIRVGEQTRVTISADNTLNQDIPTKITLNLGTGASMSGVLAGKDCSGNQCTGATTIPAKGRSEITVEITGEGASEIELTATITATVSGKDYPKTEKMIVSVINCGDGKCTTGETTENCCKDCGCQPDTEFETYSCKNNKCVKSIKTGVIISVIGFIIVGCIIIFIAEKIFKHLRIKHEAETKILKEKETQEGQREKIRKLLPRLKKDINAEHPPSVHTIAKQMRKRYAFEPDKEILREEYLALLDELESEVADEIKFCGNCGEKVDKEDEYCGECGARVR